MSDLKPCPFCGATDPVKRYISTNCRTCGGKCDNDNWNHRPTEDALTAKLEALRVAARRGADRGELPAFMADAFDAAFGKDGW